MASKVDAKDVLLLTLPDLQLAPKVSKYPPIRLILYSKVGTGKSTMAATFHKAGPVLVQCWDAADKATPYWRAVKALGGSIYPALADEPMLYDLSAKQDGSLTIPVRYGLSKKGQILFQVEHYADPEPEKPTAYIAWKARMTNFRLECAYWATLVTDSTTQMANCHRNREEFVLQPTIKDPGLWFAATTSQMERDWTQKFVAYPLNVVLCSHIARVTVGRDKTVAGKEEFEGVVINKLRAPGRLGDADGLPSQYGEMYRLYRGKDIDPATGERERLLQTRQSGSYNAHTQLHAPNDCIPDYDALWANFDLL